MSAHPPHPLTYDERALLYEDTLIVADLHLGRTHRDQLQFPTPEYDSILDRFNTLVQKHTPERIVLAGDVFQQFDQPPREAVDTLEKLRQNAEVEGADIIAVPGNHDTYKFQFDNYYHGIVQDEYTSENVTVIHGHIAPTEDADLIIAGHLHPVLEERGSRWPCFLYGERAYRDTDVVVIPAFADTVNGVNMADIAPPINLTMPVVENGDDILQYRPMVYDEQRGDVRVFPRLKDF